MKKGTPEEKRSLVVTFCCNRKEYEAINKLVRETTCRSVSEYARKTLLKKPVSVKWRNVSLDRLIDSLNDLRRELESVDDKQALSRLLLELKEVLLKITDECILKTVLPKAAEAPYCIMTEK